MPTSTLGKILNGLANRIEKRGQSFEQLARRVADGATVPLDEVERTLQESEKTPDDLRERVERITRRRELASQMSDGEVARTQRAEYEEGIAEIRTELESYRRQCEARIAPLRERVRQCADREAQARQAVDELRRTASEEAKGEVAAIRDRLADLGEQIADLRHKEQSARRRLQLMAEASDALTIMPRQLHTPEEIETVRTRLARYERERASCEAAQRETLAQLAMAEKALLAVE